MGQKGGYNDAVGGVDMINETITSSGKNEFKDYTFSSSEWSAPTMVSAEEIKNRLNSFNLIGRRIKDLRMIGLSYFLTRNWIEDAAYNALPDEMPEEERQLKSNYDNISSALKFSRYSQIDEPLLVKFEDDDIFEIDTPQEPEYRFSMNCIPWFIDAGTNAPNVEANVLFKPCIGKKIVEVAVDTYISNTDPMFRCPFDDVGTKREMVSRIVLWLEGDIGLSISGWVDYCKVACIDRNNNTLPITFEELKPALFNWEDLHIDTVVGFEAESGTLNFGKAGRQHTETPYMTLVPSAADTCLYIAVDDFDLFDWSMTHVLRERFDEYGDYVLTRSQWGEVVQEAKKIVSFDNFDALFDYMTETSRWGLIYMNYHGAEFWKNIRRYQTQQKDIDAWTRMTMSDGDTIRIYGF